MGKQKINRPRGTRDFSQETMYYRKKVEGILRRTAETFGYHEIATPTFEHLDLFTMKSGEEIVDQLYTFRDKGDRTMALRPELTAAAMRFFSEEMAYKPKPVKVYYMGNCFRYERPQKGRYREFWQFGAESIGTSSPEAAAEIVSLACHGVRATGLRDFVLRVGHLGVLRGLLELAGFDPNDARSAMTLIDKGNFQGLGDFMIEKGFPEGSRDLLLSILSLKGDEGAIAKAKELVCDVETIVDAADVSRVPSILSSLELLERISDMLGSAGVDHLIDFGIARGLDYYTGMVFEIDVLSLGAEKQICGGGEYDLNEVFSLNIKGTSGFAIGFDRLVLAMENEGLTFPIPAPVVGVLPTPGSETQAFALASQLRSSGFPTELEVMGRGLKKALSRLNDIGVAVTIIIGEQELEHGNVILRDMGSGEQEEVPLDRVLDRIAEIMAPRG